MRVKKENKEHAENYRPISLVCLVYKILERCVFNSIKDRVYSVIDSSQDGFITGRSCLSQLVEVFDFIGSQLHNERGPGWCYLPWYVEGLRQSDSLQTTQEAAWLRFWWKAFSLLRVLHLRLDAEGNGILSELAGSRNDIGSPSGVHFGAHVVSPICELSPWFF